MGLKVELSSQSVTAREQFSGNMTIRAQSGTGSYAPIQEVKPVPPLKLNLLPASPGQIIPGSLVFSYGGVVYIERSGIVYRDINLSTNAGTAVGTVDYAARTVELTSYPGGVSASSLQLIACLTHTTGFTVTSAIFRTAGAPLRPSSLQITAVRADTAQVVTATADLNGNIDSGIIKGTVDSQTGIVKLRFTTNVEDLSGESEVAVIPTLLRYNAVVQTTLPLSAELLGLDPVRLPSDGRVPIFRESDVVVLHNTKQTMVSAPAAGGSVPLTRGQVSFVEVVDTEGRVLPIAQYTVNYQTGVLTWANPLVLQDAAGTAMTLPLTVYDRVEHMAMVTEVQITGQISLSSEVPWGLDPENTFLSSAVAWGDLQARLFNWFTQQTWNNSAPNWSDLPIGGGTTAQYNSLAYPQIITNMGAIEGKWALVFTSNTSFNVVEEKLGIVATGTVATDCSPMNPLTGTPYFTIRREGWGTGWSSANAVRFNTSACLGPLWVVRTVVSGQGTVDDDRFKIQIRGDAD